jgi:hypothetical protein
MPFSPRLAHGRALAWRGGNARRPVPAPAPARRSMTGVAGGALAHRCCGSPTRTASTTSNTTMGGLQDAHGRAPTKRGGTASGRYGPHRTPSRVVDGADIDPAYCVESLNGLDIDPIGYVELSTDGVQLLGLARDRDRLTSATGAGARSSRTSQVARAPPSTGTPIPVTKEASLEHNQTQASATSEGSPSRLMAKRVMNLSC